MVFPGGSSGSQSFVVPNGRLAHLSKQFKVLLVIEIIVLPPLIFAQNWWVLIQLISVGLGYYAVKDEDAFKPPSMQMYFVMTVIGVVLSAIQLAYSISAMVETAQYLAAGIMIALWSTVMIVLIACSRVSWVMYKEMLTCSASNPLPYPIGVSGGAGANPGRQASGGGGLAGSYAGVGSYGFFNQDGQSEAANGGIGNFTPFQGEGRRLGG